MKELDSVLRQVSGLLRQSRFPEAIALLEKLHQAQPAENLQLLEALIDLYEVTG